MVTRSLNGNVSFKLTDGSIEKLDIVRKLCRVLSMLSAGSLKREDIVTGVLQQIISKTTGAEPQAADRTEFSEMGGNMVFKNGIGTNNDLVLKSPLLRVEGAGRLDLHQNRLEYQTTVALVKSCEGQGGKGFADLANYPIPVAVSGPFDNLDIKPDFKVGILKFLQKQPKNETQTGDPQSQPPQTKQQSQAKQSQPPQTRQPADPKKQMEEVLQKGLQDLFKKK